ncbi:MAG: 4-alpha-glucanotransferase [Lachnospiraceae bacterium]|nr:4-alpha-glucanotransferase [Lachnospiraceae bacterium]
MKKQKPLARSAGTLMPVSSLPSPYGIGAFGKEAYDFVDFLVKAGQKYWQVLPLGPTSYGDSPYQSFSAFAGNPYFIDLDALILEGLLKKSEVAGSWGDDPVYIDYHLLYQKRYKVLKKAFDRSKLLGTPEYKAFLEEHDSWLSGYADFMAKKEDYPPEFWFFCQYYFFKQWKKLKDYANGLGIEIIGDIPIYVALDSADVVDNPEMFLLDEKRKPINVAGVPPDMFSADGQLWGNPLYDWDKMEQDDFAWWKRRMSHTVKLFDVIRIDHFVGIVHYFSIPAGSTSAKPGVWMPGPGEKLLNAINSVMDGKKIIAEDLGEVSNAVIRLRDKAAYPGMKPMIYAFSTDGTHEYLPGNFVKNIVVYAGTHDNEPLAGYFARCKQRERQFARKYLNVKRNADIPWAVIRSGYASCADLAVFQIQDYLNLGDEARINIPSTLGGLNWRWRLLPGQADLALAAKIKDLCDTYGR